MIFFSPAPRGSDSAKRKRQQALLYPAREPITIVKVYLEQWVLSSISVFHDFLDPSQYLVAEPYIRLDWYTHATKQTDQLHP